MLLNYALEISVKQMEEQTETMGGCVEAVQEEGDEAPIWPLAAR